MPSRGDRCGAGAMAKQWGCRHNTARVPSPWGEPTAGEGDDGAGWRIAQGLSRDVAEPQSESPRQPQGAGAHARRGRAGAAGSGEASLCFPNGVGEDAPCWGAEGAGSLQPWAAGAGVSVPPFPQHLSPRPPAPFPRPTGGRTVAWVPSQPSGNL